MSTTEAMSPEILGRPRHGGGAAAASDGAAALDRSRQAAPARRGLPLVAWLVLLAILAAILSAGYLHFAPSRHPAPVTPPAPPIAITSVPVTTSELVDQTTYIGSLQAAARVAISTYSAGHVTQLLFQEGQQVESGTVLLRLDDRVARADLASAQSQLSLKQSQLQRDSTLRREGFVPQTSIETSQADVLQAQTEVAARQADVDLLTVRAPFAGTLGQRQVELGQYVTPGQTLVELIDLSRMVTEFRVPQRTLASVQPGAKLTFTTDAFADRSFAGEVRFIAPQIDPKTRSFLVRAELQVPGRELLPGLFGHVQLETGTPRNLLTLPETALVRELTGSFVYRIEDGKARLTRVETGTSYQGRVEVRSGLKDGDQVVLTGQFKLKDGDPVTDVQPPPPAGDAATAPKA